eukprot:CAMPEP_0117041914 /NCGR_PEP_ID=MMETSP0472-20121206/29231_1 /TAXON_ID=693140 ORGANISM="Tiarina fusus, Strain LIS" /NCGR_SAMPLE_ID=MMETSP0472 /ASSEMBLY_ACC=CAM_ASM_000603 /LENGTH=300 /DNA_ID=CAMNT_0004753033 /DNA_START=276 /DNA_END=1178 /DNA_ORIENTATION=+
MGVERIDDLHPLLSQFTTLHELYQSKRTIQESPLLPLTPSLATTMVQITSKMTPREGALSLKDIMQRPSLSPSMVATACADIIYKTNTHGLWLEFPKKLNTATLDRIVMEESRDEPSIRHSSSEGKEESLRSTRLEEYPQASLLMAHFHARTGGSATGDDISGDPKWGAEVPKCVLFDRDAVEFSLEVANSDDSLLSCDDEDDQSDGWSFATDPDASFEAFDEVSVLTQETLDDEDVKMLQMATQKALDCEELKMTTFELATEKPLDFEAIKMTTFQMAIQDATLTSFLADLCSPAAFEG